MLKRYSLALLATFVFAQPVLAAGMMSDDGPCSNIVKACIDAGYKKSDADDKGFWFDCMKPLVLGKTVKDVTVDPADVKKCRAAKIKMMTEELKELKKAK